MSLGFVVFLLGLFGVPIALLAMGHKLRRRSPRVQAMFRGAIIGHVIAGTIAVVWSMIPPEAWEPSETARGVAGMWSLLLLPVIGALAYSITARGRAAIAVATLGLPLQPGAPFIWQQQSQSALVGTIGPWARVDDGGPAIKVDGTKWSAQETTTAFPLAVWNGMSNFTAGTIKVDFKLVGGASDQNAGIVLGLQPNGDYLFVRYNTKDGNVAVWKYADGARTVLTHGHEHAQLPIGAWHELTVTVAGNKVTGSVRGTPLTVEHTLDRPLAGQVGVWTKRDAITVFRNYRVNR